MITDNFCNFGFEGSVCAALGLCKQNLKSLLTAFILINKTNEKIHGKKIVKYNYYYLLDSPLLVRTKLSNNMIL